MAKGTPATVALSKAGIAFTLHEYDYDPNAARIGMQAAEALGVDPARLLKTLMAKAGNATVCVLVPSDTRSEFEETRCRGRREGCRMLPARRPSASPAITSAAFRRSARKSACACSSTQRALAHQTIIVNGGRRGLQIELAPADLVRA